MTSRYPDQAQSHIEVIGHESEARIPVAEEAKQPLSITQSSPHFSFSSPRHNNWSVKPKSPTDQNPHLYNFGSGFSFFIWNTIISGGCPDVFGIKCEFATSPA